MIKGIYKTKAGKDGKPNIVAILYNEELGETLSGGYMAAGVKLTFGKYSPFKPEQWELIRALDNAKSP